MWGRFGRPRRRSPRADLRPPTLSDVPRTQNERSAETRRVVIAAARERFTDAGFSDTSVAAIAAAAKVSKGALYHHFADKTEVLAAVYEAIEQEICEAVLAATSDSSDPVEALRAGCRVFLDACLADDVRRIVLEEAPAALGWHRWRAIDLAYGFGLLRAGLAAVPGHDPTQLETRSHLLLVCLLEGALLMSSAADHRAVRDQVMATIEPMIGPGPTAG